MQEISQPSTIETASGLVSNPGEAGAPLNGAPALPGKGRRITNLFLVGVGSIFLAFHFLVIALSLAPDNPLKHQFKFQIYRYVNPFFSQSWNLFSPNPINSNMTVLLKFIVYENGRADTTQWVDIMPPLIEHRKKHFWSPTQRITKFLTSCTQSILENRKMTLEYIAKDDSLAKDSIAAATFYSRLAKQWFGHTAIIQYASYVFKQMNGPQNFRNADSTYVTYKIFDAKFPRFSKRNLNFFDLKNYQFAEYQSEYQTLYYRPKRP